MRTAPRDVPEPTTTITSVEVAIVQDAAGTEATHAKQPEKGTKFSPNSVIELVTKANEGNIE